MIRVVLVDDQPLVRTGIRALLERADDVEVVGEAADGREGVALVRRARPDVVLMDLQMPVLDGVAATRQIVDDAASGSAPRVGAPAAEDRAPGPYVVVLTTFDDDANLFAALRAGASGFLLKDASPDELRAAVRTAAAGDALLSPAVTARVVAQAVDAGRRDDALAAAVVDRLTDREREVLAHVGRGMTNDEIGAALFMSPATARTHVGRILAKLGVRDRAGLVVVAYEAGLVRPGTPPT
ncbi:response regulator transcription factor [Cellulosimicrobium cellulans]|uniref:response regulator n=1 Tax=Cellulosimicrobium cellulans TaxID=1710 RepID=UPI001963EC18|nr:response regulator transcription factor [Cellulosimicrobium cellulans]MBN0039705.1 response regulator transcription factor [Cellulosimicrobium cellulans]